MPLVLQLCVAECVAVCVAECVAACEAECVAVCPAFLLQSAFLVARVRCSVCCSVCCRVCCSACRTVWYSGCLQYVAVRVAVCCSVCRRALCAQLECLASFLPNVIYCNTLHYTAPHCTTLHHTECTTKNAYRADIEEIPFSGERFQEKKKALQHRLEIEDKPIHNALAFFEKNI